MLLVQYDGALRREELIRLRLVDVLPLANGNVRVQSGKGGSARIVNSSAATRTILERYIAVRFKDAQSPDEPLFVGDGARNRGKILSLSTWSKTVSALAVTTSLKNVSTHTMRHLRLTHLAMAGWDLHEISRYAGHASLDSTMLYIHLAESLTNTSYSRTSKVIDAWVERTVTRLANEGLIPAHAGVAQ
jgi:integrase